MIFSRHSVLWWVAVQSRHRAHARLFSTICARSRTLRAVKAGQHESRFLYSRVPSGLSKVCTDWQAGHAFGLRAMLALAYFVLRPRGLPSLQSAARCAVDPQVKHAGFSLGLSFRLLSVVPPLASLAAREGRRRAHWSMMRFSPFMNSVTMPSSVCRGWPSCPRAPFSSCLRIRSWMNLVC